uniref:disks large-associated protein 4-like n=1 Tax=Myxine glutinosa TaxID=7769 RepID=UPI00358DF3B4
MTQDGPVGQGLARGGSLARDGAEHREVRLPSTSSSCLCGREQVDVSKTTVSKPENVHTIGVQVDDERPSHNTSLGSAFTSIQINSKTSPAQPGFHPADSYRDGNIMQMPDADKYDGRNQAHDAPCRLISVNTCMGDTSDRCTTETDGEGSVDKCEGPDGAAEIETTILWDGRWFLAMLDKKIAEMQCWCKEMEGEMKNDKLSEEVLGKILSAVGSAHLLMAQKFQQFRGLCMENLNPEACPHPSMQDLAGFWDLLQLPIEDVRARFASLRSMRAAGWVIVTPPDQNTVVRRSKIMFAAKVCSSKGARPQNVWSIRCTGAA